MEKGKFFIGKVMSIGAILSVVLILSGGIIYLFLNGKTLVHYESFRPISPPLPIFRNIWNNLLRTPLAWIQSGLLALVLLQIIRVALTAWMFVKIKDIYFSLISIFILLVLIYAIF